MLGVALYGLGRYLWNGATDLPVPALEIGGVRYLPLLRYRLTPYGTEVSIVNELGGSISPTQVEARVGRSAAARALALGVRRDEVAQWREWIIGITLDLWRQPRLAELPLPAIEGPAWGGALRARAARPLRGGWFGDRPLHVLVEAGMKGAGYVPGEPLRSGLIARAGVGIPLGR
jgi:hypothetical protein